MLQKLTKLLLMSALAVLVIALFIPSPLEAASEAASEKGPRCSDGIDNDGDGFIDCRNDIGAGPDPDCKCGGDDGGGLPANVPTEVQWTGLISEPTPRPCVVAMLKPNGDHGTYACNVGLPEVTFNLLNVERQQLRKRGDENLCDSFDNITLTPTKYIYDWEENCSSGSCRIRIESVSPLVESRAAVR